LGPDGGEQTVRFSSVAVVDGKQVDLVISAVGAYQQPIKNKQMQNGLGGDIKKIFQKSATSLGMEFAFADPETGTPVTMQSVEFSFFDIDGYAQRDVMQSILICGASHICLTSDTSLQEVAANAVGCRTFAPKNLDSRPNPKDLQSLTDSQKGHTLTAKFSGKSSFRVTSMISNGKANRPMLFAGVGVTCPADAKPDAAPDTVPDTIPDAVPDTVMLDSNELVLSGSFAIWKFGCAMCQRIRPGQHDE
jgi:hypothetical protein